MGSSVRTEAVGPGALLFWRSALLLSSQVGSAAEVASQLSGNSVPVAHACANKSKSEMICASWRRNAMRQNRGCRALMAGQRRESQIAAGWLWKMSEGNGV